MMDKPTITVIVAVFNGAATLSRCLSSIIAQTYSEKEIIVIDGGSTDETIDILKVNGDKISYWNSKRDDGIYDAWNKGLSRAHGEWICFLGADDFFWQPDILERLSATLISALPCKRVVYGQLAVVSARTDQTLEIVGEPWLRAKARMRQIMSVPHVGLMHHRSIFEERGRFDTTFRIAGDYELLLRELKDREALFVPMVLVGMCTGGISSNPANTMASLREVRAAQEKNGVKGPGILWIMAVIRVRVRILLWRMLGEHRSRQILDWGRRLLGKAPIWTKA